MAERTRQCFLSLRTSTSLSQSVGRGAGERKEVPDPIKMCKQTDLSGVDINILVVLIPRLIL